MKRFWSFALVACLLLALTPADRGTPLDTGQQEVAALVAHTSPVSSGIVVFVATNIFDMDQVAASLVAMSADARVIKHVVVGTAEQPNANTGSGAASDSARPHPSGGYNVLKMPRARRT